MIVIYLIYESFLCMFIGLPSPIYIFPQNFVFEILLRTFSQAPTDHIPLTFPYHIPNPLFPPDFPHAKCKYTKFSFPISPIVKINSRIEQFHLELRNNCGQFTARRSKVDRTQVGWVKWRFSNGSGRLLTGDLINRKRDREHQEMMMRWTRLIGTTPKHQFATNLLSH